MKQIIIVSMLITGATIGAGILGLPIETGPAGVFPAIIATVAMWILLTLTAFIIANRFLAENSNIEDYPTILKKDFGTIGKILVITGYLINYYGIMVAYLCASVSILEYLIPVQMPDFYFLMIFFIPTAGITLFGLKYILKANSFLMLFLFLTFFGLCYLICSKIESSRYLHLDWNYFSITLPIVVNAFLFHNIIPTVCRSMNNDKTKVKSSILIGTIVACIINIIWIVLVLGALPLTNGINESETIMYAFKHNEPATVPLAIALKSKTITIIGFIFSFCAIITSFVSVVIGLQGFIRDILISTFSIDNKLINSIIVFLPPLVIALAFPHFFLKAVGYAGGVGGLLIFGIYPALLWIKSHKKHQKIIGTVILLIFLYIMSIQITY